MVKFVDSKYPVISVRSLLIKQMQRSQVVTELWECCNASVIRSTGTSDYDASNMLVKASKSRII